MGITDPNRAAARLATRRTLLRMDLVSAGVLCPSDHLGSVAALIEAIGWIARGWTPAQAELHPKGRDGKFTTVAERIAGALYDHIKGGGKGDPLAEFNREQVRKTAVALDLKPRRGASEEEIKKLLIDQAHREHGDAHAKKDTRLSAVDAEGDAMPVPSKEERDRAVLGDKEYERRQAAKKATSAKKATKNATTRTPAMPVAIHDMFTADDATIEAALRDVYEGRFGPYTTKVTVSITRAGTRVDKRGREHKVEPSIGVDGKIYDAQGHEIGYFGRGISPVDFQFPDGVVRREVWAHHEVVQLGDGEDKRHQGKGFGGEFNRRAIEWYRASGVHGINQSDHNGYVWASQGFNFGRGGRVPDYLVENIQTLIGDLRAGKTKSDATKDAYLTIPKRFREAPDLHSQVAEAEALLARLQTTKPGEPDYPTAYEISQLGRRAGQRGKTALWLGKLLWVSADQMILNPDEGEVLS